MNCRYLQMNCRYLQIGELLEYILIADMIVYYIVCVLVIAVNCNHRGPISHGL